MSRQLPVAVLWALLVAVYAPALTADFVNWDDHRFLIDNPHISQGLGHYVLTAFTEFQFQAYQPLHLLSYLPDLLLWPERPAGFHLVNLLLFAALVALLYRLALRFVGPVPATLACALVALHPICVEPVAWITSRKDLLSGVLFFAALAVDDRRWTGFWLARDRAVTAPAARAKKSTHKRTANKTRRKKPPEPEPEPEPDTSPPPSWTRTAGPGLALFACALLAKSSTVCYPLVLFAYLCWLRNLSWRRAALTAAPHALLAAAAAIIVATLWSSSHLVGKTRPVHVLLDIPASVAVYLRHIAWPVDLAALYHHQPAHYTLGGVLILGLATALAVTWRRLPGPARFAAFATGAALAPVINLVPMYFRYADRYTFLAWLLATLPLAIGLHSWLQRPPGPRRPAARITIAAAILVALGLAALAHGQARVWRDSQTLWQNAAELQPDWYFVRLKYGETLREAEQWDRAGAEYQAAIRLDPDRPLAYAGLLYLYARQNPDIPRDTADRWLAQLGAAMADPRASARLRAQVADAGCARCDHILLLLELRRWPRPDSDLITAARSALDAGQRSTALIYLDAVRDRDRDDFRAVVRQVSDATPPADPASP